MVVNANPLLLYRGKDTVPVVDEAGKALGPVWIGPSNTSAKVVTTAAINPCKLTNLQYNIEVI